MRTLRLNAKKSRLALGVFILAFSAQALVPVLVGHSSASSLTNTLVRFDNMSQNTFTSGTVCAAASSGGAGTEDNVKVTFPTGYTVSATVANWAVDTTNKAWPSGAAAWPGITAPTGTGNYVVSGQSVTFQSSDLTDTTEHCFNWTNSTSALKTAASPANDLTGTVATQTSAPAVIDSGNYSTATVSNDQVSVSAQVNPTFQMAMSASSDNLSVLSSGSVAHTGTPFTMTVSTNAKPGWQAWASSANAGLKSTAANYTIASNCSGSAGSNSTLSAGTEGYNLGVTKTDGGSGTISVDSFFTGGTSRGGGLCSNLQTVATSNGSANNAVLTFTNNAAIAGSTPAANDYADTETFVAGGLF